MNDSYKSVAHPACRTVLRPLASMLLRCGMTWKEFSDLSKSLFVAVATEEFGLKGRPTNVSRVSILTGISRKEVKRQRDMVDSKQQPAKTKTTDATRVLSAWYQDTDYVDENGNPALLPETGPAPSFESLCATYGGDIAMPTMLKELLKSATIERAENDSVRAVRRYYQPALMDDENVLWSAAFIRDLSETLNNDVFPDSKTRPRFVGKADNPRMTPESISKFHTFVNERGQVFLEEIDDWLTEHECEDHDDKSELVRLGVGLFAIQDEND